MKDNYIYGKNAVLQGIEANKVEKIFIAFGAQGASINRIFKEANKNGISVTKYDRKRFRDLEKNVCPGDNLSQNVIAVTKQVDTLTIVDILEKSYEKTDNPLIVALDEITDPQNLGAIARSAECAGATALLITERNSAPINSFAVKASAGALTKIPIAKVTNLATELSNLKEHGFWIVGTEVDTDTVYTEEIYNSPIVLVIGSEGNGMRPRVKKVCDHLIKIPMLGTTQSLNASVSAGIVLFEILRQRDFKYI
ncbi:MAG: 23S rRNA (guanosine(2251)-2'-O)-methyltransferase RlmB [Candidatus Kapaibacterium sp.]|nr:23S rRNA (guanosine(2251)-2'-O)-methyltransferase RlmB [Ignavibacteriota bacterium]MCB9220911.1 23S rRNA (guanosine(2251)-2'-O)-methyltransferase RlmB [Ignavibacteria bacterium]